MKKSITFNELGLNDLVIRAILNMGFEEATAIQEQTIPVAMEGRDLIGQAQTGTGKTAAYGIPLVERVMVDFEQIQGIVLSPTRELAIQVAEELNKIGEFKGIHSLPIYGGQEMDRQIRALKKRPQIIVATPGRLMDHMRRKTIRLNQIKIVVLDEADEMLNMGFVEDIETILDKIPEEHQTLLFSATMPRQIQNLAQKFMKNPELISIKAREVTVDTIEQHFIEVQDRQKFDVISRLIDIQAPELAIIFCRTKRRVDEISEALSKRGYSAEAIHGDLSQSKREIVLRQFKEGTIEILVATDVAARGLDISGVTHVYNFDIPQDPEGYVHRVGRTARAGKTGLAVTLVTPREMGQLRTIEQVIRRKMIRKPVPTMIEAVERKQRIIMEKLLRVVAEEDIQKYQRLAEELLEENDSITLLSAALKMMTKEPEADNTQLTEPVHRNNNFKNTNSEQHRNRKEGFWSKGNNRAGRGKENFRGGGTKPQGSSEHKRKGSFK